jgi:zinc/manganese transport system permease protein
MANLDPLSGIGHMLGQGFIRHALVAGTAVGLCCGLVGYFLVLRSQVFSGEALSHVAYTGAVAALAAGVDARIGLFAATIAVGAGFALLGPGGIADDVVIGTSFAWILGLGTFFLAIYTTSRSSTDPGANARVLFGSLFGISASAATVSAAVAVAIMVLLAVLGRPLLFTSIDPVVAAARGLPVQLIGVAFLALVGACAAEASQVVGALLLFGLLAAPGAAAQRLTDRPWPGLVLSGVLGVAAVWTGIALSYAVPQAPASFSIMTVAATVYLAAGCWGRFLRVPAASVA